MNSVSQFQPHPPSLLRRNVRRTMKNKNKIKNNRVTAAASNSRIIRPRVISDYKGLSKEFALNHIRFRVLSGRTPDEVAAFAHAFAFAQVTEEVLDALTRAAAQTDPYGAMMEVLSTARGNRQSQRGGGSGGDGMWSESLPGYLAIHEPAEAIDFLRYVLFLSNNRVGFTKQYMSAPADVRSMLISGGLWNAQFLI